jgi:hypothetical protein
MNDQTTGRSRRILPWSDGAIELPACLATPSETQCKRPTDLG